MVRTELNLPQDLTKYITSCRKVILSLAAVVSQARVEMLNQTREVIDLILGMEGGKEFVTELVKMELILVYNMYLSEKYVVPLGHL